MPVKIHFLNKLLDTNLAQATLDPPPALVTGAPGAPFLIERMAAR